MTPEGGGTPSGFPRITSTSGPGGRGVFSKELRDAGRGDDRVAFQQAFQVILDFNFPQGVGVGEGVSDLPGTGVGMIVNNGFRSVKDAAAVLFQAKAEIKHLQTDTVRPELPDLEEPGFQDQRRQATHRLDLIIQVPRNPKEIDPLPDSLITMPCSPGHRYALPKNLV